MKRIFILIIIALLLFIPIAYCVEIDGEISIPNKDGGVNHYSEIYTYDELYSVLEDLSSEYIELLEEYNSSKTNYEEEIKKQKEEIKELKNKNEEQTFQIKNDSSIITVIIIVIIIGLISIACYYSKKQ